MPLVPIALTLPSSGAISLHMLEFVDTAGGWLCATGDSPCAHERR